ncbi:BamA/TamA family outer membrane protein [Hymenobacter busanensis]|uniref:translocation and assembly module lipoprotein TamL n=1 Tax=Hymenobacter busanensis TaxID=2607656 RepID=UPI00136775EB|nr:BamA/TamA family outer membrane protein [Hymenobacter busanensis]QHJ06323.1 BamA/TamA family outer membrane protein [Hymenobacter busanensis]
MLKCLTAGLLLAAAACSPLHLLGPRQRLLTKVQLEGLKEADQERVQELFRQRPNDNFPLPKLAIYDLGYTFYDPQRLQRKLDTTRADFNRRIRAAGTDSVAVGRLLQKRERRIQRLQAALDKGNAIMRLGDPPVIYDSALTRVTETQIGIFLRSKGFFRSRVSAVDTTDCPTSLLSKLGKSAKNDTLGCRRAAVIYNVQEGPQFRVTQLNYDVADTTVARLIRADTAQALIRVGQPYDEELIGRERTRLENMLKNRGYYDFRQQYITLEADTSFAPATVRLLVMVENPPEQTAHRAYTVRNVSVITDAGVNRFGVQRDTVRRNGINFLAYDHRFSTRILDRKVAVRPGDPYSLANSIITQRQLAELDVFRFTGVNYQKVRLPTDTAAAILDATVLASPQKRLQLTDELGGTFVAEKAGPFGNFRLRVRNAFGGAEVLDLGVRAGLEGQYKASSGGNNQNPESVYTLQLGANASLSLPQFLVPWRTNRLFTRYSPRTRITTSYTYVNRPEYTRTTLEGTYDYIWQRSVLHQYVLTPLNISLVNTPNISEAFRTTLLNQSNSGALLRSFDRLLIPSVNATSLYNSNDFVQTLDAQYLRLFAEMGAPFRQFYTRPGTRTLIGTDRNERIETLIGNLLVLDYARFSADYRRYHKLTPNQFLAWRLNGGLVQALTPTEVTRDGQTSSAYLIPYDKYFFAGGGSSVRAWRPRRLGIGSYPTYLYKDGVLQKDSRGLPIRDENIEQPGELLLEGSVEYRFPVYDYIRGALFTDFGNVWTLQKDARRDTTGFTNGSARFSPTRFYREFAVGAGAGLRFDFTFLIVRLDFAWKVYDPTAVTQDRWALRNFAFFSSNAKPWLNTPALNVGIGYPF